MFLMSFHCTVQVLLVKPVIAADGHTYEKSAMEHWLGQHVTSPVTGAKLMHARLVPNRVLRSIIANSSLKHHSQLCLVTHDF